MTINHKDAIEFLLAQVNETSSIDRYTVLNIHALLSNNLITNPKGRGQLRNIPVGIGKTAYHPPEVPKLINECFDKIILNISTIQDPFEAAFFAMVHLPYLQPFEDVNKRVSRLCANYPILKANFSPLSFTDVPKNDYISGLLAIYEFNRIEYLRDVFVFAYKRSAKKYKVVQDTLGKPDSIALKFREELSTLTKLIISDNLHGNTIIDKIGSWTKKHIDDKNQQQFSRIVEKEIASLHEGNLAIYGIKPDAFLKWHSQKNSD